MRTLIKYGRALVRFILIVTNNLYCIPSHVVWLTVLLPVRKYAPALYYKIEGLMFSWLLSMVSLWSWSAGYNIVEQGDDITRCLNKKTLIIVNHQSTADVPLLMAAFNAKPNVLPNIMWIMDKAFKYTNFGIVSWFHLDFFIASGKSNREASIKQFKTHLKTAYVKRDREWMVLFPEGGFLRKRREVSQRFAKKNNFPLLEHVTLPRLGALFTVRDVLMTATTTTTQDNKSNSQSLICASSEAERPHSNGDIPNGNGNLKAVNNSSSRLDYILDITIAYPNSRPLDLQNIIHGLRDPCETNFYYKVYPASEIPKDDESLSSWIYKRFIEKETLLDNFYKTQSFVPINNNNSSSNNNNNNVEKKGSPVASSWNGREEKEEENSTGSSLIANKNSPTELWSMANGGGGGDGGERGLEMGPCLVQQDLLRFVILHLFFITSTYVHMRIFYTFLEYYYQFYAFSF